MNMSSNNALQNFSEIAENTGLIYLSKVELWNKISKDRPVLKYLTL